MRMVHVHIVLMNGVEVDFERFTPRDVMLSDLKKDLISGAIDQGHTLIPTSSILYIEVLETGKNIDV
jgi:hypothetical protein